MSDDFYDFESNHCTAQSLVHSINFLGENIIGVEVGIYRALNLCMLVQLCKNVKMFVETFHRARIENCNF